MNKLIIDTSLINHSYLIYKLFIFFFSRRRWHTRSLRDWSSDVCSSDLSNVSFECHVVANPPVSEIGWKYEQKSLTNNRSEERRVEKECRSRWSPYH